MLVLLLSVLLPALVLSEDTWDPHYISCTGFPEGFHEAGCWGKAVCVNGNPVVTKCAPDQMFDYVNDACVPRSVHLSSTACDETVDCAAKVTGRHPDLDDGCKSYYICMQGAFFGRMYCPPRTIFNEALQVCDYPGDVPAPCGPHTGGYSLTPAGPYPEFTQSVVG